MKISFSGPLSGGALYGEELLDGMQLAVNEINAQGLEWPARSTSSRSSLDDKYNPSETAINAQRLVQRTRRPRSSCRLRRRPGLQVNNEQQVPAARSTASVPQITARGNKLTLRIPPEFTSYVPAFVKHAMTKYGKNIAFAHGDHDYAKAWTAVFKPAWKPPAARWSSRTPCRTTARPTTTAA